MYVTSSVDRYVEVKYGTNSTDVEPDSDPAPHCA